ncbi:hypothetical protein HK101_003934, partial [Irineochytrium annulatum]
MTRTIEVFNNCQQTVWPGIFGRPFPDGTPMDGGWEQAPGSRVTVSLPEGWCVFLTKGMGRDGGSTAKASSRAKREARILTSLILLASPILNVAFFLCRFSGRIWARTGCTGVSGAVGANMFHCETGDCGGTIGCQQRTGIPNVLLAEWTFVPSGDIMDVSGVDAYNVGISIEAIGGRPVSPNVYYQNCTTITCNMDLNTCPDAFKVRGANGQVVACINNADKGQPQQLYFKQQCPDSYSWP